jgi:hypothetical protein
MGIRLSKLYVFGVESFNIGHIISCSVLKILIIKCCRVILPENFIFAHELPHFKSVKGVILQTNLGFKNAHKYLRHCVNLEVFRAEDVAEIDDAIVSDILNAGGFRKLSEIMFSNGGPLHLETAMLLVEKCNSPSILGNLST